MSFAFRPRNLSCFYCGSRSTQKWNGGAQEWRCKSCEAINYLDKKGQITEPPPQSSPLAKNQVRYAHATIHSMSEDFSSSDEIFCSTCLKNQHIVKENLASYLPPEDDADYDEYITRYESYRDQLEHRYPQVCSQCAPRAREQIRKASYVAKTDHLRRMIDRTKASDLRGGKINLVKGLGVTLGFVGSRGGALFQAGWHALILMSHISEMPNGATFINGDLPLGRDDLMKTSRVAHFWDHEILRKNRIDDATRYIPLALVVSLLTIWWNPQLRAKQLHLGGKLQGLTHFYILQSISFLARTAAFYTLSPPHRSVRVEIIPGIHAFMVVFILSSILISSRIVQLNTKPLFTFPTQSQPILPNVPQPESKDNFVQMYGRNTQSAGPSPFPINKLAPTPLSNQLLHNPATPPPEDEYDADTMDWTPTVKPFTLSLNPQPRAQPIPSLFQGPSPFHGTLPPAPIAPSHKLRNPTAYQPGKFRKASEAQQTVFATNISTPIRRSTRQTRTANQHVNPYDSDTTDLTNDDDDASAPGSEVFPERRRKRDMEMAQPKFFLQEDQCDTGLEDIFGTTFGLQDTPREISSKGDATPRPEESPGWFGWNRRKAKGK